MKDFSWLALKAARMTILELTNLRDVQIYQDSMTASAYIRKHGRLGFVPCS